MVKRKRWTAEEREAVYKKMDGHCAYCGCELSLEEMQVDHIIPLRRYETTGGADRPEPNSLDNLLPACRSCNHYKDTMSVETFRSMLEREPEILARDSVAYRNAVRFGLVIPNPGPVKFYFERKGERDEP